MFLGTETRSDFEIATCESRIFDQAANSLSSRLAALDLGPIMFKLSMTDDGLGWSREKVVRVADEYIKFLTLCAEIPGKAIVPSKEVDEMWHCHILDTAKYAQDCQEIFGYFLHHFPYLGLRGDDDARELALAFHRTKVYYVERFGERHSKSADCMTGCGSVVCSPSSCTNNAGTVGGATTRANDAHDPGPRKEADCMTGCGSVVCSPSSCTNNEVSVNFSDRPTFEGAIAA